MNLNRATRTRILDDLTVTIDPTGSTVELNIDGTWYPATWLGSPVQVGTVPPKWTQTAQTTGYFAGPDATASGATVLVAGQHFTLSRVTSGQDIIVGVSSRIDVG